MDVDTSDFAEEEAGTVAYILTLPTIALCVLTVGYMLHIKIIKTSFQEKDITWKLDVTNSCLVSAIYTHSLLMQGITYLIQDLHHYTGSSFCYLSKVFTHYSGLYLSGHTLMIAGLKYILIVRWKRALEMGKEKIPPVNFWGE